MQPLQICIGPTIRIGRESWCLPYAGFFTWKLELLQLWTTVSIRPVFECYWPGGWWRQPDPTRWEELPGWEQSAPCRGACQHTISQNPSAHRYHLYCHYSHLCIAFLLLIITTMCLTWGPGRHRRSLYGRARSVQWIHRCRPWAGGAGPCPPTHGGSPQTPYRQNIFTHDANAMNPKASTMNHESSNVNHKAYTMSHELYTMNPPPR